MGKSESQGKDDWITVKLHHKNFGCSWRIVREEDVDADNVLHIKENGVVRKYLKISTNENGVVNFTEKIK